MGFSPQQIRDMSAWQYLAALEGYISANSVDGEKQITVEESDELWDWIEGL